MSAIRVVAEEVVVLGPLPRYRFDKGKTWSQTPAYLAERRIRDSVSTFPEVTLEILGRKLTAIRGKCKALVPTVKDYFADDELHLSSKGYGKRMEKLPEWMSFILDHPATFISP